MAAKLPAMPSFMRSVAVAVAAVARAAASLAPNLYDGTEVSGTTPETLAHHPSKR